MAKVWHIKDPRRPADSVYCGRGSPYGNPYRMYSEADRDFVCEMFERNTLPYIDCRPLKGRDLHCSCKPKRCHADAIFKKANS